MVRPTCRTLTGVRSLRKSTVRAPSPAARCSRSAWCFAASPGCSDRWPASRSDTTVLSCTLQRDGGQAGGTQLGGTQLGGTQLRGSPAAAVVEGAGQLCVWGGTKHAARQAEGPRLLPASMLLHPAAPTTTPRSLQLTWCQWPRSLPLLGSSTPRASSASGCGRRSAWC